MRLIKEFRSNKLIIPSFTVGVNDWVTIIFPSDCLSDEKSIRKNYVKSFLDTDFLDVRPWIKHNIPSNMNYDDGIIEFIQNRGKKEYILFGPISDHEKYYHYLDSKERNFGIIEFFHPCSVDVQLTAGRKVIDLSKNNSYNELHNTITKS